MMSKPMKDNILIGFLGLLTLGIWVVWPIMYLKTTKGSPYYVCNSSYVATMYQRQCELEYYSAKEALVREVDEYIHKVAPTASVNALAIVEMCDKYEVDLKFVLAQGHHESHFGTKGIASKTNSIFNVLAYDGRTAEDMNEKGHGYKHPDQSIEPYLKLLRSDYMVKGRTEQDLLCKFVNSAGKRYASAESYEANLSNIYVKIESETSIPELYSQYKRLKIIAEK